MNHTVTKNKHYTRYCITKLLLLLQGISTKQGRHKHSSLCRNHLHWNQKVLILTTLSSLNSLWVVNSDDNAKISLSLSVTLYSIDQSHKSHDALVPYPTIHHSEQKCSHFCSEWCIVVYGQVHIPQYTIQNRNVYISVPNGVLWDMQQVHCGICEIVLS